MVGCRRLARESDRVLTPRGIRLPTVHRARAASRRMGGSPTASADSHRFKYRARNPPHADPDSLGGRRAAHLAPSRAAVPHRRLHRLLRRRLPGVPPSASRTRGLGRRQLEDVSDEFGCAGCRPERGRGTDRGNHRAVRDPRRRAELRRLDALHASHAPRRGASPARRRSSASQDVAAGEGGARLGGSGIANCARSLRARPTSTFAST